MAKWICILLLLCGSAQAQYAPFKMDREPFDGICEILTMDCSDIEPPFVVTTGGLGELSGNDTVLGMYVRGDSQILISPFLTPEMFTEILIHETVHYILYQTGVYVLLGKCDGEGLAREISGGPWGPEEKSWYGCNVLPYVGVAVP